MLELQCDAGPLHSCKGSGGSESLKQLEKNEFKMFALSSCIGSEGSIVVSHYRDG